MPDNKRQHFVPRFYLRSFSSAANKDLLSLLVLATGKLVENAAISRQGYRDYFYGQSGLDEKLKEIEARTAPILRDMIELSWLPRPESRARQDLLTFVLFQHVRTPSHGDELSDNIDSFMQLIAKDFDPSRFVGKRPRHGCSDAVGIALEVAEECRHFVDDLGAKLFVNDSGKPFITSDNSAVFYNQFLETRNPGGIGNTGLGCKGLQIFLPISPRHLLILFDPAVYRVGGRKRIDDVLALERSKGTQLIWRHLDNFA